MNALRIDKGANVRAGGKEEQPRGGGRVGGRFVLENWPQADVVVVIVGLLAPLLFRFTESQ